MGKNFPKMIHISTQGKVTEIKENGRKNNFFDEVNKILECEYCEGLSVETKIPRVNARG